MKRNNQKGQSLFEYVLLLSVVILIVFQVIKSPRFRNLIGTDGEVMTAYQQYLKFTYRHGYYDQNLIETEFNDYTSNQHPTYANQGVQDTRFFLVSDRYGL